jgi:hypothetical protein
VRSSLTRSPVSLLAPLLVAVVETAVVAPLLALLDAIADRDGIARPPVAIVLGVIGLFAYALTGVLQRREIGLRALQGVLIGGAVIFALFAPIAQGLGSFWNPVDMSVVILAAIAAVVAWWRGMQYGSDPEPFSAERLNTLVKVGWVALVLQAVLIATIDGGRGDAAASELGIAMPVAAAAGLILLALGQIEQARINASRRGGRAPERRGWLTYAVIFVAVLLVIAALGSALFGDEVNWILTPLSLLVRGVAFVVTWILIGIAFVFFILLYPLIWLIRQLRAEPPEQQTQEAGGSGAIEQIVNEGSEGLPDIVQSAVQVGSVVLIIAIALVALALTMRRVRKQADVDTAEEERESLWSRELALSQLKDLFRRDHEDGLDRIDLNRPPGSVRETYRALQALAQRDGVGRRASETPAEFGRRLGVAWPGQATAIADLTRRYERVRYAGSPDEPEIEAARRAWSSILTARESD